MTKEDFISILSKPINKKQVSSLAVGSSSDDETVFYLIDLTAHKVPQIAFRAAWILENIISSQSHIYPDQLSYFIESYPGQYNNSCKRHFSKILIMFMQQRRSLPDDFNLTSVIEVSFEWLIDPLTPVAVKVNCLDILFYLKDKSAWIKEELTSQINFLLKNGSAAMQSRGKKILNQMNSI